MKRWKLAVVSAFVSALVFTSLAAAQTTVAVDGLTVAPIVVPPGAAMSVSVQGNHGGALDWITLVKTTDGPGVYRQWCYLTNGLTTPPAFGVTSTMLSWTPPQDEDPMVYEFRVFRDDGFGRAATSAPVTMTGITPTVLVSVLACTSSYCIRPAIGALVELRDRASTAVRAMTVGEDGLAGFFVSAAMFTVPYVVVHYPGITPVEAELCGATGCLTKVSIGPY